MPEIASAAEAPISAAISGSTSELTDMHRGDDLHVVDEAFREQRPDRPVDQARGQRFLLGRTALALEEAAGNAARGIGLLLIVHGEREEVAARGRLLQAHRGDQHYRLAHGDEHGAVGLAGELARLDRYGVVPILKTFLGIRSLS